MSVIYFHCPYCLHKCPYCDFYSCPINLDKFRKQESSLVELYDKRLQEFARPKKWDTITSIFFGGGTPSLLSPKSIEHILNLCAKHFNLAKNCEITLEANPGTVTQSSLQDFSHVGINRLSLGIQSFDDKNLKFLGRIHNRQTALMAINYAQKYFTNYSLDLIYALPKQTLDELESELSMLSQISPPHLSFYQLTLEKGTPFYRQIKNPISDTLAAKMFNYVNHSLKKMGYINYEISNFAKPHQECLHNMSYWNGDEYIGCGPTAASRIQIGKQWFEGKESIEPKDLHLTKISARERMREMIITGLRTKQGFNLGNLTKFNLILDQVLDISKVSELSKQHLVKLSSTHLRVLTRGKLFLNYINQEIIL